MTSKQRKAQSKREYEIIKDIRNRYESGESTTFAERNILFIYLKKMDKKRENVQLITN